MRGELKELEAWFVDHGHLAKDWRDQFEVIGVGFIVYGPGVTAAQHR